MTEASVKYSSTSSAPSTPKLLWRIATLPEFNEEILRFDKREGQNMNAMEGSSLLPVWDKGCYQTFRPPDVQPSNWKNPGIQKNVCKTNPYSQERATHELPLQTTEPAKTAAGPPCSAVFYRWQKFLWANNMGNETDAAQLGHRNVLYRAALTLVIY